MPPPHDVVPPPDVPATHGGRIHNDKVVHKAATTTAAKMHNLKDRIIMHSNVL